MSVKSQRPSRFMLVLFFRSCRTPKCTKCITLMLLGFLEGLLNICLKKHQHTPRQNCRHRYRRHRANNWTQLGCFLQTRPPFGPIESAAQSNDEPFVMACTFQVANILSYNQGCFCAELTNLCDTPSTAVFTNVLPHQNAFMGFLFYLCENYLKFPTTSNI